jgi:hypothetical protein
LEYFVAGKYQTLEEYFSQLCTCFAWGATDSDKVSFYLTIDSCENYVVPRGVQRNPFSKHLLDAHPTAYNLQRLKWDELIRLYTSSKI